MSISFLICGGLLLVFGAVMVFAVGVANGEKRSTPPNGVTLALVFGFLSIPMVTGAAAIFYAGTLQ